MQHMLSVIEPKVKSRGVARGWLPPLLLRELCLCAPSEFRNSSAYGRPFLTFHSSSDIPPMKNAGYATGKIIVFSPEVRRFSLPWLLYMLCFVCSRLLYRVLSLLLSESFLSANHSVVCFFKVFGKLLIFRFLCCLRVY